KMIGMMYLVLTALLALNVNSAILQKFKLIDDSLVDVNGKTDKAADGTVKGIQEAVAKNRNQAADQQVLKQSEEIREKTKEMIAYIDEVRDKLITATENSKAGDFHNMEATDKVAITMLGGAKNGLAYPLKDKLNGYADYIKQYVPEAEPLALDAKVDPKNMTYNGSPLAVDPKTNHGKIEFTARPGNFDASGNAKANWTGSIRINQNGRDTTFKVTVPYTITKPVMQIQSASVQALYYRCGNKLSVQVPALGAQYQPSFSASGAAVITGQKGEVTLVPDAREVTLNVSSGGNAIGSQEFKVRPIPLPTIKCFIGSTDGEDKKVTLARGKRPVQQTQTINGPQGDISSLANVARADDRLFVEVKGVQRQNFQGK
nr:hypothetical protein [Tanacetum cinerariifolium]